MQGYITRKRLPFSVVQERWPHKQLPVLYNKVEPKVKRSNWCVTHKCLKHVDCDFSVARPKEDILSWTGAHRTTFNACVEQVGNTNSMDICTLPSLRKLSITVQAFSLSGKVLLLSNNPMNIQSLYQCHSIHFQKIGNGYNRLKCKLHGTSCV